MPFAGTDVDRQTVKCDGSDAIFFIEGGRRRGYSWESWIYHGRPSAITVPCAALNAVPVGELMPTSGESLAVTDCQYVCLAS
jgi:hypothetical protein